jgi:hypothetical protein
LPTGKGGIALRAEVHSGVAISHYVYCHFALVLLDYVATQHCWHLCMEEVVNVGVADEWNLLLRPKDWPVSAYCPGQLLLAHIPLYHLEYPPLLPGK